MIPWTTVFRAAGMFCFGLSLGAAICGDMLWTSSLFAAGCFFLLVADEG